MPLPQPPRGDPLDEAMLAWAEAAAHLAATCRNQPLHRPQLTVCPAARCGITVAAIAACYWWWARTWCCACQWHLAFEIHPLFRGIHWAIAVAASIAWQLWDRVIPTAPQRPRRLDAIPWSQPRMSSPRALSG